MTGLQSDIEAFLEEEDDRREAREALDRRLEKASLVFQPWLRGRTGAKPLPTPPGRAGERA